jgi:heterodisulfide reductase subunit C
MKVHEELTKDIRFEEALKACMNCGVCTAICPAATVYNYDPRHICEIVQSGDEKEILILLKSDSIWECGQCMSCKPRCPRGNIPGVVIQILRKVSQEKGFFRESVMGRLQVDIVKNIGRNLYETGYCVTPDLMIPANHPEQGPVWEWIYDNRTEVMERVGASYHQEKIGALRDIPQSAMDELHEIFKITGCIELFNTIMNGESWHKE